MPVDSLNLIQSFLKREVDIDFERLWKIRKVHQDGEPDFPLSYLSINLKCFIHLIFDPSLF